MEREAEVRRYVRVVDGYLTRKNLTLETLARGDARAMWQDLLRCDRYIAVGVPAHLDADEQVSRRQALAVLAQNGLAVSESTFKRALRSGYLTPADTTGVGHLYRVGDLFDPKNRLIDRRGRTAGGDAGSDGRYAHSTLTGIRSIFCAVLDYAESEGVTLQRKVRTAEIPKNKTRKAKQRALTLAETARIAGRLHVVHQLVLWLCRILGLRLGEAFGLLVEDVVDAGPGHPGLIIVQSQGGKKYRRRRADGTTTTSDRVDETKRDSDRLLVVPAPLMDLVRVVIEVFHTYPDGTVRTDARLVPGLQKRDAGGQSAFREALKNAAAAEGLDVAVAGRRRSRVAGGLARVTLTPQHLRKSFASGLQAGKSKIEDIRAFMGHKQGQQVIHLHYLLEDPELKPQRKIAKEIESQIAAELAGPLMVGTTASCTTGAQPALARRKAEIDLALSDNGWLRVSVEDAVELTVADAAVLRGVSEAQIRDDIRSGRLTARTVNRTDQNGDRYLVHADDLLARCGEATARCDMRDLAGELGIGYDTLRQYIRRHPELRCDMVGARDYHVPEVVVRHVTAYFHEQTALQRRAVPMPQVARDLELSVAAISTLLKNGVLAEDARFHGGIRSVTKASLENYTRRGLGVRRRNALRT